jgi:hypothetical protein
MLALEREPLTEFESAIRSPATKRKYVPRLAQFFTFVGLKGSLEDQSERFVAKAKRENEWAELVVTSFLLEQKARAERGRSAQARSASPPSRPNSSNTQRYRTARECTTDPSRRRLVW